MTRRRIVIVGAGVAGFAAALGAKSVDANADVTVIDGGGGASALGGGLWDIAPDASAVRAVSVEESVRAFVRANPGHPYARLSGDPVEAISEAHQAVLPALAIYQPLDLSTPGPRVITDLGVIRRTATAQRAVLTLAEGCDRVNIASMYGYRTTDAAFLARALREDEGIDAEVVDLANALTSQEANRSALQYARALAAEDRPALLDAVERSKAPLALPPILDFEVPEGAGEVSCPMTGLQGIRLRRAILDALSRSNIRVATGRVEVVEQEADRFCLVTKQDRFDADRLIVTTGKHVGGGISVKSALARENLLGLPIHVGGRPESLSSSPNGPDPVVRFGESLATGGPGFSQGVGWNVSMQALRRDGHPLSDQLFVAGDLLEGVDPARDGTGLGCAVTTGYRAGRNAAA